MTPVRVVLKSPISKFTFPDASVGNVVFKALLDERISIHTARILCNEKKCQTRIGEPRTIYQLKVHDSGERLLKVLKRGGTHDQEAHNRRARALLDLSHRVRYISRSLADYWGNNLLFSPDCRR